MAGDNDGEYIFKWFEGPETPETVKEIIMLSENPQESTEDNENLHGVDEFFDDDDDDDDDNDGQIKVKLALKLILNMKK
ncbi:hypothetical protein TSAR_001771 [Trichomalopsis sarcophagae]|uniref:Uncharacterized protein n=1 Tax=Trichomalopsis sarcophagae TaxID=543379 RepID=A0A232EFB1_9HYME|nr:hypothetical protein TSAR_001771 [Trichomalopsis sarcophagae]